MFILIKEFLKKDIFNQFVKDFQPETKEYIYENKLNEQIFNSHLVLMVAITISYFVKFLTS